MVAVPERRAGGLVVRRPRPETAVRQTAVYGTAQPPRGISGAVRRYAYGIPEHHVRHWVALMVADRVDLLESTVRARPLATVAAVAGGVAVGIMAAGLRRRGRP